MRSAWRYARLEQIGPPDAEGRVKVSVQFELEEEACRYILGLGPCIEVLEPPELRERVIATAQEVLAFYAARSSTENAHPNRRDR